MMFVRSVHQPLYFLPYLLRMLKLHVVFSPTLRAKYGRLIADKHLFTVIAVFACVACVAAALSTVFWASYRCAPWLLHIHGALLL
jgi:hypothetical protein